MLGYISATVFNSWLHICFTDAAMWCQIQNNSLFKSISASFPPLPIGDRHLSNISCQSTSQHSSCKTLQAAVLTLYRINYLKWRYTYQKMIHGKLQLLAQAKSSSCRWAPLGGHWYSCSSCLCFHTENRMTLQLFCKVLTGKEGCMVTQEDTVGWKVKCSLQLKPQLATCYSWQQSLFLGCCIYRSTWDYLSRLCARFNCILFLPLASLSL